MVIINAVEQEKDTVIVNANTEVGEIKGIWKNKVLPIVGKKYFVELTINDFNQKITCLSNDDILTNVILKINEMFFTGYCEDMDEDVYYIRFNPDWLEMIEIPENGVEIKIGNYVMFSAYYNDVLIYPYSN